MLEGDLKWGALRAADSFNPPFSSGELWHGCSGGMFGGYTSPYLK